MCEDKIEDQQKPSAAYATEGFFYWQSQVTTQLDRKSQASLA
jgi:hypothetical protein